jgi:hypothetical protein
MGRNTKEIELFGEKLILTERSAYDVISFTEFSKKNSNDANPSIALYQVSLIIETALKYNKKEIPVVPKANFWKIIIRFFGLDNSYKVFLIELEKVLEFNAKLLVNYLLEKLTQKELFDILKEVYLLEGVELEKINNREKKN